MESIPTTAVRTNGPWYVNCRIYRKSDGYYWTVTVSGYPTDMMGTVQQLQAWTCGLAIHPNFQVVTIDSVEGTAKHPTTFEVATEAVKTFLEAKDHVFPS